MIETSLAWVRSAGCRGTDILYGIASFYVLFFRGTPLPLQTLFIYLALPQAGIVLPAVPTAIVALSLNYGRT